MLPFFSSQHYAVTTNQHGIVSVVEDEETGPKATNVVSVEEQSDGSVDIVAQRTEGEEDFITTTFTPTKTGVYTIDVTGIDYEEGEDLYFLLTTKDGKQVRLAAYQQRSDGNYKVFSSNDEGGKTTTQVDVLLQEGVEYEIKLPSDRSSPNEKKGPYGTTAALRAKYNIHIEENLDADGRKIIQSDYAASMISNASNGNEELEEVNSFYKPQNGRNVNFDYQAPGRDIIDAFGDIISGAVDEAGNLIGSFAEEYVVNPFEETICELLLAMGDFSVKVLNDIMGQEVTVAALVYNQVDAVNANFFENSGGSSSPLTGKVKSVVSQWYSIFHTMAIAVYLAAFLAIGLRILLGSTNNGMGKAREMLFQWGKGVVYLFFMPFLIRYAFMINDSFVSMLCEEAGLSQLSSGTTFGGSDELTADGLEFRSPEYVTNDSGKIEYGSDELTEIYMDKVAIYEGNLDLMRVMRAYAGATKRFVYVLIWWILLIQVVVFIVQYYKRFFIIAFLIAMFPLICVFSGISVARGHGITEISSWMRELFTNIFMQAIQAIIYTIITGVCVSVVSADIQSSGTLNWLIIIMAINFVSEGEKILRKILGALGNTAPGVGETGRGIRGAIHDVGRAAGALIHGK